jgi:1,4-dihydroxy-6-naphthoate synthase
MPADPHDPHSVARGQVIELTLAHSPDPDDAFMWWPITGKVTPTGEPLPGCEGLPRLETGRLRFRAIPIDIERLNRRAIAPGPGESRYDITAISFRAYADVAEHYALTACGSSFGLGFGPKVVARREGVRGAAMDPLAWLRDPAVRIALPGVKTTAFMVLGLMLGLKGGAGGDVERGLRDGRFIEMPFGDVIPAVAHGRVDAGLVIHEGQVTFEDAGLVCVVDLGEWWQRAHECGGGTPLPLGGNAIRRDLDERFGPGTQAEVVRLLRASIDYALSHRDESIDYTMPFALANAGGPSGGGGGDGGERGRPTRERVDRYIHMYVNEMTVDMGQAGRASVTRLLHAGAVAGLCPALPSQCREVEIV